MAIWNLINLSKMKPAKSYGFWVNLNSALNGPEILYISSGQAKYVEFRSTDQSNFTGPLNSDRIMGPPAALPSALQNFHSHLRPSL